MDLFGKCAWCGKRRAWYICSRCQRVSFCGASCQKAHWEVHKHECRRASCSSLAGRAAKRRHRDALAGVARRPPVAFQVWLLRLMERCAPPGRLRALPAPDGAAAPAPVVVCGPAAPRRRRLECAGQAFSDAFGRRVAGALAKGPLAEEPPAEAAPAEVPPAEAAPATPRPPTPVPRKAPPRPPTPTPRGRASGGSSRQRSASARRAASYTAETRSRQGTSAPLSPLLEGVELFTLLGLRAGGSAPSPSDDEIRKAYRRLALEHHPDRVQKDRAPSQVSPLAFRMLHEAYRCLSNRAWREMYESTLPFDDTVPSEGLVKSSCFFTVFRPVFERNSKWSRLQPVPGLGDADTPLDRVNDFYNFWLNFDSWRDCSPKWLEQHNLELHDVTQMHRLLRRSYQKENVKTRQRYEVHERLRVLRLVDMAKKLDPRLAKHRRMVDAEAEQARRARRRRERAQARRREREIAEQELRERIREDVYRQLREGIRRATKDCRRRMRHALGIVRLRAEPDWLRRLSYDLSEAELQALVAEAEALAAVAGAAEASAEAREEAREATRAALRHAMAEVALTGPLFQDTED